MVKSSIEHVDVVQSSNPFSIMLEIAKATYIEDIMFGKPGSIERSEVLTYNKLLYIYLFDE